MKPRKRGTSQQYLEIPHDAVFIVLSGWLCQACSGSVRLCFGLVRLCPGSVRLYFGLVRFCVCGAEGLAVTDYALSRHNVIFDIRRFGVFWGILGGCGANISRANGSYRYTTLLITYQRCSVCNTKPGEVL